MLDEGLLQTRSSLTEARVIFALGQHGSVDVADLRAELDLDAGYLSRLVGAMGAVRAVLGGAPRADALVLRPPYPGDYGWIVQRHGALNAQEYGWNDRFETLVTGIVAGYLKQPDPKREAVWIAEMDGQPVGCVACVRKDDTTAQLCLLLVEPSAHGCAIGGRLVAECTRFARHAGYPDMTLFTFDVLDQARRIYQRAGFEPVQENPHHTGFGKDLVGQDWHVRL